MPKLLLLILAFYSSALFAQPEINVKGNGQTIIDGDITPNISDHTIFDTAFCLSPSTYIPSTRSYVIQNLGNTNLVVSSIQIQGGYTWTFQISGIAFPATILPGDSVTFAVDFGYNLQSTRTATLNITNNDADEAAYNFDIKTITRSNVSANIAYTYGNIFFTTATVLGAGGIAPYASYWNNGVTGDNLTIQGGWCPPWTSDTYIAYTSDSYGCGIEIEVPIPCPSPAFVVCYGTAVTGCFPIQNSSSTNYYITDTAQYGTFSIINDSCFQYTPTSTLGISDTISIVFCDGTTQPCSVFNLVIEFDTTACNNLQITENKTNVTCFGGGNGSIAIEANGGNTPYTFLWQNGSSSSELLHLTAGIYTCTITDFSGCSIQHTTTITEPSLLVANTEVIHINCFGAMQGTAYADAAGGIPPYSFVWDNSHAGDSLINAPAGSYFVIATDFVGCIDTHFFSINQPQELNLAISYTDIQCFGSADGTASASVSGGVSPYNLIWNNGATQTNLSSLDIGCYTLSVTDSLNCVTVDSFCITAPPLLQIQTSNDTSILVGETALLYALAQGGVGNYNYTWLPTAGLSCVSCPNPLATPDSTTVYSVFVSDSNNCQFFAQILITVDSLVNINNSSTLDFMISIFPNPTEDNFTIQTNTNTVKSIFIYNSLGQLLFRKETIDSATSINVENFPNGLYFIEIHNVSKRYIDLLKICR